MARCVPVTYDAWIAKLKTIFAGFWNRCRVCQVHTSTRIFSWKRVFESIDCYHGFPNVRRYSIFVQTKPSLCSTLGPCERLISWLEVGLKLRIIWRIGWTNLLHESRYVLCLTASPLHFYTQGYAEQKCCLRASRSKYQCRQRAWRHTQHNNQHNQHHSWHFQGSKCSNPSSLCETSCCDCSQVVDGCPG